MLKQIHCAWRHGDSDDLKKKAVYDKWEVKVVSIFLSGKPPYLLGKPKIQKQCSGWKESQGQRRVFFLFLFWIFFSLLIFCHFKDKGDGY